jgi:hypothetical protein
MSFVVSLRTANTGFVSLAFELSIAGDTLCLTYCVIKDDEVPDRGIIAVDVADPATLGSILAYHQSYSMSDVQAIEHALSAAD